jgi:hypothetical protein
VHVTDCAFDWLQQPIPHAATVWIQQGFNVVLEVKNGEITHETMSFDLGFNRMGECLSGLIDPKNALDLTWQKLINLTNLIASWTTDAQAVARRNSFKVTWNEKDSGSTHQ